MMFSFVPPAMRPTVITTGSRASKERVTAVCSSETMAHSAAIGSRDRWGAEPWPPSPRTVTWSSSAAAYCEPGREVQVPRGISEE